MPEHNLSSLCYSALYSLIAALWEATSSDDFAILASQMAMLEDGESADPAMKERWAKLGLVNTPDDGYKHAITYLSYEAELTGAIDVHRLVEWMEQDIGNASSLFAKAWAFHLRKVMEQKVDTKLHLFNE